MLCCSCSCCLLLLLLLLPHGGACWLLAATLYYTLTSLKEPVQVGVGIFQERNGAFNNTG